MITGALKEGMDGQKEEIDSSEVVKVTLCPSEFCSRVTSNNS